jgi:mannan endo-1,4-beta-mannosidase
VNDRLPLFSVASDVQSQAEAARIGGSAVPADTSRSGRHRRASSRLLNSVRHRGVRLAMLGRHDGQAAHQPPLGRKNGWIRLTWIVAIVATVGAVAAALLSLQSRSRHEQFTDPAHRSAVPPSEPGDYIGIYARGAPQSYGGISAFIAATGVRPRVVVYYSGWQESFQAKFARTVVAHDAVPLVQINPTGISLAAIASGQYDTYLRSYATAVKTFGYRVILSFGHEMNGYWYSWGYRHTSPAVFVAAWRHIVTLFRASGARNVTWLWTCNVMHPRGGIPSPARWWPGSSYVNWVGMDGYYYQPSWTFASLFGPTIKVVRTLTLDRILISETAAPATAGQAWKVADLFAGVHRYGLLGFVWFDADKHREWRLRSAASAAFRRGARRSAP